MLHLYIMRHGETDYNKQQLAQGASDIPLNETGKAQAADARKELAQKEIVFDAIYASPLIRAIETAEILTGKTRDAFTIDDRLVEMHFGEAEGKSFVKNSFAMTLLNTDPEHYDAPVGGETVHEVFERAGSFLDSMREKYAEETKEDDLHVFVATHGMTIRAMLGVIRGTGPAQIWETRIGNCDIFHLTLEGGIYEEMPMLLSHFDPYDPH